MVRNFAGNPNTLYAMNSIYTREQLGLVCYNVTVQIE